MAIIKPNNNTISAITALPAAIKTGGLVLLNSTSLSSASSVTISSAFSSTYKSYRIIISGISPATDNQDLYFTFIKSDGSEDTSNDYRYTVGGDRGSSESAEGSESSSSAKWARNVHNDTGTIAGEMVITNPQQSIRTAVAGYTSKRCTSNAYAYIETFGVWINGSTSHTGIKFYPASGNWNDSGSINVYGQTDS